MSEKQENQRRNLKNVQGKNTAAKCSGSISNAGKVKSAKVLTTVLGAAVLIAGMLVGVMIERARLETEPPEEKAFYAVQTKAVLSQDAPSANEESSSENEAADAAAEETAAEKTDYEILTEILASGSPVGPSSKERPAWKDAYWQLIQSQPQEGSTTFGSDMRRYCLYDIDKDGVPELLLRLGTCEADFQGNVYGFNGETVQFLGSIPLSHSSFYSYPSGNGVLTHAGHMGYAAGYRYYLDWGALQSEEINADFVDARGEYIDMSEIIPGAAYIQETELTNSLPLDEYETIAVFYNGTVPTAGHDAVWPGNDPLVYQRVMDSNFIVSFAAVSNLSRDKGSKQMFFQEMLQNIPYSNGDLKVASQICKDFNGDGIVDCLLTASNKDSSAEYFIILTIKDGAVRAYHVMQASSRDGSQLTGVDDNGICLFEESFSADYVYRRALRFLFDGDQCCPMQVSLFLYQG